MTASSELLTVHLLQLPVPLAGRSRQWFEELLREFSLIAASAADDDDHPPVPRRLMAMVDALTARFAAAQDEPRERLEDAIDRGLLVIEDHVLQLPAEAAPATRALGAMLDEADRYCQQGRHLLTLATPDELLAYRHWYLGQIADQLEGAAPVSWPDARSAVTGSA
jgi:hypothetical protein